jgi:hypothetical protein
VKDCATSEIGFPAFVDTSLMRSPSELRKRFDRCSRAHVQLEPLGSLQVLSLRVVRVGRYQRGAVGSERFGYRTADSFSSSDSVTLRCSCATIGRCSAVISTSQT